MNRRPSGFSLLEIIFVLLILGIIAALCIPRFQMGAVSRQSGKTLARQIAADLRYTRQLALTHAAGNPQGYELVMTGAGSYSGYEIRNRQTASTIHTYPINPAVNCTGGSTFGFGPLGNLLGGGDTSLQISVEDESYTVTVISATGSVRCQKN